MKKGLEYFPLDVDMFQDIRIRKLIKRQGGKAVSVYVLLLCIIYKDGYYMRWDEELPFIISEQTGFDEAYIREAINCCMALGLFDTALYQSHRVLTSKGIQERYAMIRRSMKRVIRMEEFNVISSEERGKTSEETPKSSEERGKTSEPLYKRKGKKRKEKEIPPPPTACVREGDLLDSEIGQMKKSPIWLEHIQMRHKVRPEETDGLLEEFAADCRCNGMTQHSDLSDAQRHFNNWLRIRKEYEQQGREDRRRDASGTLREQACGIIARMQAEDDAAAGEVR